MAYSGIRNRGTHRSASTGENIPSTLEAPRAAPSAPAASSPVVPVADAPWDWPWLRWRPGEGWTLFWILLIHASALAGLLFFPVPGWGVLAGALALTWIGGIGTTVAYHRALAHRAVRLHPAAEAVLTFFAIFNGSGAPASWAANHRLHHAKSDTDGDVSSPRIGGFWWSHLRWLWQAEQAPVERWCPDLDRPRFRSWERWQIAICGLSLLAGAPFGWAALFWMGPMRLVFSLHAQCFVNSLAHMREGTWPGEDSSRNIAWLGVVHLFQGENWHRNHHAEPHSARIGRTPLQIDAGWWVLLAMERVGLATRLRRPRA